MLSDIDWWSLLSTIFAFTMLYLIFNFQQLVRSCADFSISFYTSIGNELLFYFTFEYSRNGAKTRKLFLRFKRIRFRCDICIQLQTLTFYAHNQNFYDDRRDAFFWTTWQRFSLYASNQTASFQRSHNCKTLLLLCNEETARTLNQKSFCSISPK